VLDEWRRNLEALGRRPKTVELRVGVVRKLYRDAGAVHVEDLDQAAVEAWLGGLVSPATRRAYAVTWRQWTLYAGHGEPLAVPRVPQGLPRPARAAQLAAAQLAADPRTAAWIACGRWAGLRAGEVSRLRGEDVDDVEGWLYVEGKGGQRGVVPLDPRLAAVLAPWVEASGGGRLWPVKPGRISEHAGAALRAAGAADRFHQLRHFYGTAVYQATGDLYRAQRALRHASPATTQVYAQLADDALRAAVAAVP
jgi:integrase